MIDSMKANFKRQSFFITFEGGEGAGKTTLINEIEKQVIALGYSVLKTREPGGTKIGEEIRAILLNGNENLSPYAELSLFLAARAQHIFEVIGPALEEGKVVLCDRFNDSSIAYQGVARGLGMQKVEEFCEFISQGLKPHLTIYLDLDPELGLNRAAKVRKQDRIESESVVFHGKIREAYMAIHKAEQHRFRLIDATLPPNRVLSEAMRLINPLLSYV
jgi:dTMP kinase